MGMKDIGRIPVVDRNDPSRLVGMLRRVDIIRAYQRGIQKRLESHTREDRMRLAHLTGLQTREFVVREGAPIVGKPIKNARMPEGALLVTLRRGGNVVIIHGDVVLRPGDRVIALLKEKDVEKVQKLFSPMEEEEVSHGPFE
jgi:trk system potassium uptake protein TrkA